MEDMDYIDDEQNIENDNTEENYYAVQEDIYVRLSNEDKRTYRSGRGEFTLGSSYHGDLSFDYVDEDGQLMNPIVYFKGELAEDDVYNYAIEILGENGFELFDEKDLSDADDFEDADYFEDDFTNNTSEDDFFEEGDEYLEKEIDGILQETKKKIKIKRTKIYEQQSDDQEVPDQTEETIEQQNIKLLNSLTVIDESNRDILERLYNGGNLRLSQLTSIPNKFVFPETITGHLNLNKLQNLPEDVTLPKTVTGGIYLGSLTFIPENIQFPKRIGLHLYLTGMESIPENIKNQLPGGLQVKLKNSFLTIGSEEKEQRLNQDYFSSLDENINDEAISNDWVFSINDLSIDEEGDYVGEFNAKNERLNYDQDHEFVVVTGENDQDKFVNYDYATKIPEISNSLDKFIKNFLLRQTEEIIADDEPTENFADDVESEVQEDLFGNPARLEPDERPYEYFVDLIVRDYGLSRETVNNIVENLDDGGFDEDKEEMVRSFLNNKEMVKAYIEDLRNEIELFDDLNDPDYKELFTAIKELRMLVGEGNLLMKSDQIRTESKKVVIKRDKKALNESMTYQEYLNQSDPKRLPDGSVIIEWEDCKIYYNKEKLFSVRLGKGSYTLDLDRSRTLMVSGSRPSVFAVSNAVEEKLLKRIESININPFSPLN